MNRRRILVGLVLLGAAQLIMADSCSGNSNQAEQTQVDSQQGIYTKNQPVHTYQYSAERAALIQLMDLRVKGQLNTWSVWIANNGTPLGMCASKGFPIPYSSELTNPQLVTNGGTAANTGSGNVTVGQMDPNGIYPAQSAAATWVLCLDKEGAIHPQYIEPLVMAFTYPVEIQGGKIVQVGDPSGDSTIKK